MDIKELIIKELKNRERRETLLHKDKKKYNRKKKHKNKEEFKNEIV